MKEVFLKQMCKRLTRLTEDAYLAGDSQQALRWSQKLDKVIYQLMLIQNHDVLESLRAKKAG
ncbi:MAG: hypothetical protein LBH66_08840 [Oscillospiraceae bacterium]|jgi:hypothetical protein|nr:hypothetical protein [Oscillospiraceae bacterium]